MNPFVAMSFCLRSMVHFTRHAISECYRFLLAESANKIDRYVLSPYMDLADRMFRKQIA